MPSDSLASDAWRATVRVHADPILAATLTQQLRSGAGSARISVTELVDLRSAYFRRTHPLPVPADRQKALDRGREVHGRVERALAAPDAREVRVRRGAVVGQVDLLDPIPVEVKTTSRLPDLAELATERPEYIEQLGIYCAILRQPKGRLVLVLLEGPTPIDVHVLDADYHNLADILEEVDRRARLLDDALATSTPARLPRCAWYGRSCPFAEAHVCPCTGDEPAAGPEIRDQLRELRPNEAETVRVRALMAEAAPAPTEVERFRDLLYPRRAFYARRTPRSAATADPGPTKPPFRGSDAYRRIADELEATATRAESQLPPDSAFPPERTVVLDGVPTLVKTTRARPAGSAEEVPGRFPQYVLELALRCAALGATRGRLALAHESTAGPGGSVQVYSLEVIDPASLAGVARSRAASLREALRRDDATSLAPCPAWMYAGCEFAPTCQCGADPAGRSYR